MNKQQLGQRLYIHPDNPQPRLLKQAAACLQSGGIVIYPTETSYALACQLQNKDALDYLRHLRQLPKNHLFSLLCDTLSQVGQFAYMDNHVFRVLKDITPGPYTFVLAANYKVPSRLLSAKRKTMGFRISNHPVALALVEANDAPLITTTLISPNDDQLPCDPDEIFDRLGRHVHMFLDAGFGGNEVTTVIDFSQIPAKILREGRGDLSLISGIIGSS